MQPQLLDNPNTAPQTLRPSSAMSQLIAADVTFEEQVYILSRITQIRDEKEPTKCGAQMRNMRLLNGIALLLSKTDSDMAAVTFEQTPTGTHFYYSKNRPCSAEEKAYCSDLLDIAKGSDDWLSCTMAILERAIPECRERIKSRHRKLVHEISNFLGNSGNSPTKVVRSTDFEEYINKTLGYQASTKQFICTMLETFVGVDLEDIKDVLFSIQMADAVGRASDICMVIDHPALVQKIRMFGDYYGSARAIALAMVVPGGVAVKQSLSFTEVPPPQPETVGMTGNTLQMLNRFCEVNGFPPIEEKTMQEVYQDFEVEETPSVGPVALEEVVEFGEPVNPKQPKEEAPTFPEVESSVHCELTLFNHMIKLRLASSINTPIANHFKIGISKRSCWLCQRWMDMLVAYHQSPFDLSCKKLRGLQYTISRHHTGVTAGWRIPMGCPTEIKDAIKDLVSSEIKAIVQEVHDSSNLCKERIPYGAWFFQK